MNKAQVIGIEGKVIKYLLNTMGSIISMIIILGYNSIALSAQDGVPEVVVENGKESLILPEVLKEAIKTKFPDFRIPTSADIKGEWAMVKKPGKFPFITWGDYNGDGKVDVAIVLINEYKWKFIIFIKSDNGYNLAFEMGGQKNKKGALIRNPEEILLETLSARTEGVTRSIIRSQAYEQQISQTYKFKFDVIIFSVWEKSSAYFYWENGTFQSIGIGGE